MVAISTLLGHSRLQPLQLKQRSQTSFNSILKRLEEKGLKLNADTFKEIQKVQEGLKTIINGLTFNNVKVNGELIE